MLLTLGWRLHVETPATWLIVLWALWVLQAFLMWLNARRFLRRLRVQLRREDGVELQYDPPTVIIVPMKGASEHLHEHLFGLLNQKYPKYRIAFAVEAEDDPAYAPLRELAETLSSLETVPIDQIPDLDEKRLLKLGIRRMPKEGEEPPAPPPLTRSAGLVDVEVHVAQRMDTGVQKLHNQLAALEHLRDEDEVVVFADADAAPDSLWLQRLVLPLIQQDVGATTGYRWLIPSDTPDYYLPTLWSRLICMVNLSVATLLGKDRRDLAWGGSMAIRRQCMEEINLLAEWDMALSDDYELTRIVKAAGLRLYFVSRVMVPSPVHYTRRSMFAFARRQYLITRINHPWLWVVALFGTTLYMAAFATLMVEGALLNLWTLVPYLPVALFEYLRGAEREKVIVELWGTKMAERLHDMVVLDKWSTWVWMMFHWFFVLSAGVGHRVIWIGTTMDMLGPHDVRIIAREPTGTSQEA